MKKPCFSACLPGLVLILFYGFLSPVQSAVLLVPEDFPTIQGGIDAAQSGDTVQVAEDIINVEPMKEE